MKIHGKLDKINFKEIIKKAFTVQNTLVYIISFMLSMVSTVNGMAPFAIAIFAGALSNGLPAGIVFTFTLIGTMIGMGGSSALTYIFTALVFVRNGTYF
ncbi:MAG: hypothetical protein HFJ50_04695 [Clostridia bacterium]|nr:hypothetical protein [Clostridia bacterium]